MSALLLALVLSQTTVGPVVKLNSTTVATFPTPSAVLRGGLMFGSDTLLPYYSDGTSWVSLAGGGGGGSANVVEASVALTASGYFSATVTGQTWVSPTSKILCEPFGTTADGLTPEVIAISGVRATAANRVAATGFDILVFNPNGLTGTVRFHCTGA